MIKTPLRKSEKSMKTMVIYLLLMTVSFFMFYCGVFPKETNLAMRLTTLISFALSILLCLILCWRDPGYLIKDPDINFMDLLE